MLLLAVLRLGPLLAPLLFLLANLPNHEFSRSLSVDGIDTPFLSLFPFLLGINDISDNRDVLLLEFLIDDWHLSLILLHPLGVFRDDLSGLSGFSALELPLFLDFRVFSESLLREVDVGLNRKRSGEHILDPSVFSLSDGTAEELLVHVVSHLLVAHELNTFSKLLSDGVENRLALEFRDNNNSVKHLSFLELSEKLLVLRRGLKMGFKEKNALALFKGFKNLFKKRWLFLRFLILGLGLLISLTIRGDNNISEGGNLAVWDTANFNLLLRWGFSNSVDGAVSHKDELLVLSDSDINVDVRVLKLNKLFNSG